MKLDYTDAEAIKLESIIVDYHRIYEKLRTLGLLPIAKIHDIHTVSYTHLTLPTIYSV